jgi:uncharacterized protein YcbK (DUF882 family)
MPKPGTRLLAIAAALAAVMALVALPADAATRSEQSHRRTAAHASPKKHRTQRAHRAKRPQREKQARGSVSGSGTGCLPAILRTRLAQIAQQFGPVQVVSAHRSGATMPNGRTSFHASCRAVDFNPPRGKYTEVANWLKANHDGGVGTYSCGMHHIHIDNGPRVRFHHCQ